MLLLVSDCHLQDTSGRLVAYDLLTGSMLGVLALGCGSIGSVSAVKTDRASGGNRTTETAVLPKAGVVWSEGGGRLAATISSEEV